MTEGTGHVIDPDGDARRALLEAVAEHGPEALSDATVMDYLCRTQLAALPGESILIVSAARADVPALLRDKIPQLGNYGAIQSVATTLAGAHDLDIAASLWVVREFARALGMIAPGGTQPVPAPRRTGRAPGLPGVPGGRGSGALQRPGHGERARAAWAPGGAADRGAGRAAGDGGPGSRRGWRGDRSRDGRRAAAGAGAAEVRPAGRVVRVPAAQPQHGGGGRGHRAGRGLPGGRGGGAPEPVPGQDGGGDLVPVPQHRAEHGPSYRARARARPRHRPCVTRRQPDVGLRCPAEQDPGQRCGARATAPTPAPSSARPR